MYENMIQLLHRKSNWKGSKAMSKKTNYQVDVYRNMRKKSAVARMIYRSNYNQRCLIRRVPRANWYKVVWTQLT